MKFGITLFVSMTVMVLLSACASNSHVQHDYILASFIEDDSSNGHSELYFDVVNLPPDESNAELQWAVEEAVSSGKTGTVYTIISSHESVIRDSYNCLGKEPPNARYRFETRDYTEYKDGEVVRVWTSRVKIFLICVGR